MPDWRDLLDNGPTGPTAAWGTAVAGLAAYLALGIDQLGLDPEATTAVTAGIYAVLRSLTGRASDVANRGREAPNLGGWYAD